MGWGKNHTHLQKFGNDYYLFYHSTLLEQSMNTGASGFRSIGVDKATVNEETQTINKMTLTKSGVSPVGHMNPYTLQQAETMATSGGVSYEDFSNINKPTSISTLGNDASQNLQLNMKAGAWTMMRSVDFGNNGAKTFTLTAKGNGRLEIRLNSKVATPAAIVEFSSASMAEHTVELDPELFKGLKNVFFLFTSADNVMFDAWQFTESGTNAIKGIPETKDVSQRKLFTTDGRRLSNGHHRGMVIEQVTDAQGTRRTFKRANRK
jgi:arabinoxylan arabinofuranohydrolase